MRHITDLHPGNTKTDARDALIIADAARTMAHTLRRVGLGEEAQAQLKVLIAFDEDLAAAEETRLSNRIRGLLTQIHPALERVVGPKLDTKQGLAVLEQFGGPRPSARPPGPGCYASSARPTRQAQAFADAIWQAIAERDRCRDRRS